MSNTIQRLFEAGQSIWCDNISRRMIESGELTRMIDLGVVGVTSNPTIFMKAITGSNDYDALLGKLSAEGCGLQDLYEGLVLPDIADAADLLKPVYDKTNGVDGYISLEVNPQLAHDTDATVAEAVRLARVLDRPNVLIKVPATDEGIPAIETLIGRGLSINVTLIFGLDVYEQVMRAYINGLERLDHDGGDLSTVSSVASFFVSRVDTLVDELLAKSEGGVAKVEHLLGRAATANAKLAYARFEDVFSPGGEFGALAAKGARVQRPLWASTGTKNPDYPDVKYVDGLVGANTVNTLPPHTMEAALDHGGTKAVLREDLDGARGVMEQLAGLGIDVKDVTNKLRKDGVAAFVDSFNQLLDNLTAKQTQLKAVG